MLCFCRSFFSFVKAHGSCTIAFLSFFRCYTRLHTLNKISQEGDLDGIHLVIVSMFCLHIFKIPDLLEVILGVPPVVRMGVLSATLKYRDHGFSHHPHEEPMSHRLKSCHDSTACKVATDRSVDDSLNIFVKLDIVSVASTLNFLP